MTSTIDPGPSNRLVFFGATGDLAKKQIFPALQALARRGRLDMPVIGLARAKWSDEDLRAHAKESIEEHDKLDPEAFASLSKNLRFVQGDYGDEATFARLKDALGDGARPLFYLAIPPESFEAVVVGLGRAGLAKDARVVLEKPFGRDLESAERLEAVLRRVLPEEAIYRIDHFLGKEPVQNLMYFRLANRFVEALWSNRHIASIQITMAESFGVSGRGAFYEQVGAVRDVVQNHLLQVLALLCIEPPEPLPAAGADGALASKGPQGGGIVPHDARARLFESIRPLAPEDVVRGQFRGYRDEPGVKADSDIETFAALRIAIENDRWSGVPVFIRTGKSLPVTATEVLVRLKPSAHAALFKANGVEPNASNYFRFRLSPDVSIALGGQAKRPGEALEGEPVELIEHHHVGDEMRPYERLLGDALLGDASLFAQYPAIEATWRVLDGALADPLPVHLYEPGSWGPEAARHLMDDAGGWHDPKAKDDDSADS